MPPRNETAAPAGGEHSTLYVAIEVSRKSWVIGIESPSGGRIGLHTLGASDTGGLRDPIERHRAKAERAVGRAVGVLCCYEAGYEGFWLARWLDHEMSLETVVLDPASLLVNRKAKQRKTDRIDARKMVRALLAYDRGDAAVLSRVRVPSVAEEDRRRPLRERRCLVKERTALSNRIGGLLKLHGIFDLAPRVRGFATRLAEAKTACGAALPPRARREVERLAERLALVARRIAEVEAERDAEVRRGEALAAAPDCADGAARAAAKMATLVRLKGIGENDATLLTHEVFWRGFGNRRALASRAGIAPTPWASGGGAARPGDRPRRAGLDPRPTRPDGMALAALPARQRAHPVVSRTHRRRRPTQPPGDDRRARPKAADRAVALRRDRAGAVRRQARLSPHPAGPRPELGRAVRERPHPGLKDADTQRAPTTRNVAPAASGIGVRGRHCPNRPHKRWNRVTRVTEDQNVPARQCQSNPQTQTETGKTDMT